jgi:hypothetical protein
MGFQVPVSVGATLHAMPALPQAGLRLAPGVDKARTRHFGSQLMAAIGIIAAFILVLAILNRLEFGRFD